MNLTKLLHCKPIENQWVPYIEAYRRHLTESRYATHTVDKYLTCVAHFAHWTHQCQFAPDQVDDALIHRFLNDHLPACHCARPVRRDRVAHRTALSHLLRVLRAEGVIAEPAVTTPVADELHRFDDYMNQIRGLAPTTRRQCLRIVHLFLVEQFGDRPVVIAKLTPEAVHRFFLGQSERYHSPASLGSLTSALRGYFRFRAFCGDPMHGLIGAVFYPANWKLASLPKTLSDIEVQRLLKALDDDYPSAHRTKAIVRCGLDLGLRSSEIANLNLDDIDWRTGTLTVRRTKSRRTDRLPLPATTGCALANYLQFERPQTTHRALFIRLVAPRDRPLSPDLIRKVIGQAFARAELPYTRSHLLRHTLASRLLAGGSSLKEVADVLRHRSLNTTLIYAKLDSKNLSAVALPWPGGAA